MEHSAVILNSLADAIVAGSQSADAIAERCASTLGGRWNWLGPLVGRYTTAFDWRIRPRFRDVVRFLRADEGFLRALKEHSGELSVARRWTAPAQLAREGKTIVYSSHILDVVERVCDRVIIIDKGKLLLDGRPDELVATHQAGTLERLFTQLTGGTELERRAEDFAKTFRS